MIPIFNTTLGPDELAAIQGVMDSRWLGTGDQCKRLEQELAVYLRVSDILLVNCATSGIYLALRCLNLLPGQEVIIPSIHFVAAAGAVLEMGGVPVYAEVDPRTLNITAQEIDRRRTDKTVGVILNHYGGHPCDMTKIREAAWRLWILEDAANAPASRYCGQAVGTFGDAGVWSFDSMKIATMADGGALWLRDDYSQQRAWALRNLGLDTHSGGQKAQVISDGIWWEFRVLEPSGRYDSNDLLACIGRVQLRKLGAFVARRQEIWKRYQSELQGIGDLVLPPEPFPGCAGSYYLYWVQTSKRNKLARFLYDEGIYTTFRYYPLHKAFRAVDVHLPISEQVAEITLNLPIHQNLTDQNVDYIVGKVREFYGRQ